MAAIGAIFPHKLTKPGTDEAIEAIAGAGTMAEIIFDAVEVVNISESNSTMQRECGSERLLLNQRYKAESLVSSRNAKFMR
jgi:hypothetical protein